MLKFLILYVFVKLIKTENEIEKTPDEINFGDLDYTVDSIKALQFDDKIIILVKYNNEGYLGTFTEKEGFSLIDSEFPYSIAATLHKDGNFFGIADNSYLEVNGNKKRYISEYTLFDPNTLLKNSSFTFESKIPHNSSESFHIIKGVSKYIQVYIDEGQLCISSTEEHICHQFSEEVLGVECIFLEESSRILCLYIVENKHIFSSVVHGIFISEENFSKSRGFGIFMLAIKTEKIIKILKVKEDLVFAQMKNEYDISYFFVLRLEEETITVIKEYFFRFNEWIIPSIFSMILINEKISIQMTIHPSKCTIMINIFEYDNTIKCISKYSSDFFYINSIDLLEKKEGEKEVMIFYTNKIGINFMKYNFESTAFCKNYEYFIPINSKFSFNLVDLEAESNPNFEPNHVIFFELPEKGVMTEASTNEEVEKSKYYLTETQFDYSSPSTNGIYSFKYGRRHVKKKAIYCNIIFKVVTCLKMCKFCKGGGTKEDHQCLECADNYYKKESDNHRKNCYKDLAGYYLDKSEKIFKKCFRTCKTCLEGPTKDMHNCEECQNGLVYYIPKKSCLIKCPFPFGEDEGVCAICKRKKKYLFIERAVGRCIDKIPEGYYVEENDENNLVRKCQFNCANREYEAEEFKTFCDKTNKERFEKCSNKIKVDEITRLNSFQIKDNRDLYFLMDEKEKNETFKELFSNISKAEGNDILEMVNAINSVTQLLELSDHLSEKEKERIFKDLIEEISKVLTCEELEEIFKKEKQLTILTTALTIYMLISNKEYISPTEFSVLITIESCVIQHGGSKLIGETYTNELNQEDFTTISGNAVTKMISILNEVTIKEDSIDPEKFNNNSQYQFNNSIIASPIRMNVKDVIEKISKLASQYQNTESFNYGGASFISTRIENLYKKNYVQNNVMITTRSCSSIKESLRDIKKSKVKVKICIPSETIGYKYGNVASVSVIDYAQYPLLNQNITSKISSNFISVVLRDKEHEIIPVKDLDVPFHIIIKKSSKNKNFNECLFLNDSSYKLENTNCISNNLDKEYIDCVCNHLTDFSISTFNPVKLFKDIYRLFTQSRVMNSFKIFKNLNYKNAYVIYTISAILVIFFVLLIFTIRYDLKNGDFFVMIVKKKKKCCSSRDELNEEINELQKKYKSSTDGQLIELADLPEQNYESTKNVSLKTKTSKKLEKNIKTKELYKDNKRNPYMKSRLNLALGEYWFLFKDFFFNEYWFCCIFLEFESEITKTNFLVIFIVKFISTLSIATIFTECGETEEMSASYNNRDLAVSVITILINEIPFLVFELLLNKAQLPQSLVGVYQTYRINTIYRHVFVYFIFVLITVFGTINTTWVSLDSEINGYQCKFMTDFFLTIAIDCFIYQILQVLLKALIYFFILNGEESSCLKGSLLFVVSLIPWAFNLYG